MIDASKVRSVYGVGINDSDYNVNQKVDGRQKHCPFYTVWNNMLRRCYSENSQNSHPTYIGCFVYQDWLTFSNFRTWMIEQDWEGKQLDKDILIQGNKEYNPEYCIFLPSSLNNLLIDNAIKRGSSPIGVWFEKGRNRFQSSIGIGGINKKLGRFLTAKEAHRAWQIAKKELICNAAIEQTDERLKAALLLRCTQLQYDIDNGLETIKL